MKILILSCDTGEGHNSAALAIAEVLDMKNIPYEMADPIAFHNQRASRIVASTYNNMIKKVPTAFNVIYKAGNLYSDMNLASPVYHANALCARDLQAYIDENNFDIVICTHLFAMEAMTAARRKMNSRTPCFGILTDYTCIPFFAETRLDGYFIPHENIRAESVKKGIPDRLIFSTGIPVSQKFTHHTDKGAAREHLNIPKSTAMFLIMGGGVGCGNILELCDELIRYDGDYNAYILTGHNNELKEAIHERFRNYPSIHAVSFTREVNFYMNAADVMISKPGGLTSTEAAVANVPLVHILAYTGCEAKNIAFFSSMGMSVRADNPHAAIAAAWDLVKDREKAERICAMQRSCINPNAAEEIVSQIIGL